jgi:hypothetical protein
MEATVKFYDGLQSTGINYLLPLMLFDAIYIPYGFKALCPPSLGTGWYTDISSTFMELLPRLLPVATITCVSAIVDAMGMESNNRYDLLFHILVLTVPSFDSTLPLLAPIWTSSTDLFKFCPSHHFYFCIQGKKGTSFDDCTKSGIFLCAIRSSKYADIVTMLQSHVNIYHSNYNNGSLPYRVYLDGLVEAINTHSVAHLGDAGYPPVHRASEDPMRAIQGYSPAACQVDNSLQHGHLGNNFGRHGCGKGTCGTVTQSPGCVPPPSSCGHIPDPGRCRQDSFWESHARPAVALDTVLSTVTC